MTPQLDSKRLQELASQALERPPGNRRAFLREALGNDDAALRKVLDLMAELDTPSSGLDSTFAQGSEGPVAAPALRSGPLLPDRVLGGYRIVGRLGAGGMGEVYKARDVELQRLVALKVLQPDLTDTPEALSRFRREARLLASFNHPNIATIHGFEDSEGIAYLVMELVEGWTLGERLKRGPVPPAETLEISRQIATALDAAHRRGVVHRDLKPSNVMVTAEGWVKVLDFGIAKALGAEVLAEDTETLSTGSAASFITADDTITQGLMGTAPYLSPEQLRQEKVDRRSDIWAFGCVVFETLTGKKPFHGPTRIDTYSAILEREPPWRLLPDDLPSAARRLLAKCLEKQPEKRLASMKEALEILEQALEGTPTPVAHAFVPTPDESPRAGPETSPTTLGYLDSLGSYTVVERIAAGSQGELYRAWDRERKCDVALKVLRPELMGDEGSRGELEREAQALSWLRHPNIAAIYDFGSVAGIDFLVTEFVSGTTLAARLASEALPGPMVARLGAQIASALAEAHQHGILHRDLKASNVMVSLDGQAKVIDFGLADLGRIDRDKTSGFGGSQGDDTLQHRAPEVLRGAMPDEKSDVYSLGVMLYRMATGRRPWDSGTREELAEAIEGNLPAAPRKLQPTLAPGLERLILSCLAADPLQRPSSAQQLTEELAALSPSPTLTSSHFTNVPSHTGIAMPSPPRRRGWTGIAVALGLVAAASLGWWVSRDADLSPPTSTPVQQQDPMADVESLVVMPGRLLSELEQDYLVDAVPSVVSGGLSQLEGLTAKLPPSSFDVERLGGDQWRIADAYAVDAVVLPTLSLEGDSLVLALQLVKTGNRDLLWAGELRGDPSAPSDLARRGAERLRAVLRPDAAAVDTAGADPRIERLQQEGLYFAGLYRGRGQGEDKAKAQAAFERILELDPDYAPAAAELAVLHTTSLDLGTSILEVLPEIRSAAERAIELDAKNARAWAVLGYVEGGRQPDSLRKKLEYALKAVTYDPDDAYPCTRLVAPLANLSFTLALASSERATSIDPLILTSQVFEAINLAALGRPEEAIGRISQVLALEPEMPIALIARGLILSRSGYEQEALELLATRLDPLVAEGKVHPAWVELARSLSIFAQASRSGDTTAADDAAADLVAMARGETPFPRWEVMTVELAAQLTHWGRGDEALELLEHRSERDIFQPFDYLLFTPDLAPLRGDPRFQAVVAKSRGRFDEVLAILEEARTRDELPSFLEAHLADLLKRIRRAQRA